MNDNPYPDRHCCTMEAPGREYRPVLYPEAGDLIFAARRRKNLTLRHLADALDLSLVEMSAVERGIERLSENRARKAALHLGSVGLAARLRVAYRAATGEDPEEEALP